ncbi:hypothetical protein CapIbe_013897 [Capra ibex]
MVIHHLPVLTGYANWSSFAKPLFLIMGRKNSSYLPLYTMPSTKASASQSIISQSQRITILGFPSPTGHCDDHSKD